MTKAAILTDRTVLKIAGADARTFLQGLITNDIQKLSYAKPLYAALLTPQGKIICDFLIVAVPEDEGGGFLLDTPLLQTADLMKRHIAKKLKKDVVDVFWQFPEELAEKPI